MLDVEKLIQGVHEYIGRAIAPLTAKISAQQHEIKALRDELEARSAVMVTVGQARDEASAAIGEAIAALPLPKAVTADELMPALVEELRKMVAEIPAPKDGASVTVDDVMPALREELAKAIEAMPKAQDGQSITLADVEPLLAQQQATWALNFERHAQGVLERAIERMPKAKDGLDGLGFDDLSVEFDGERVATLVFQRGEQIKRFDLVLPTVIDRGVYRPETDPTYSKHDGVTFGGSYWIAQKDQPGKPGEGNPGWRLAVRRGRDGKDGARGEKGEPGRAAREQAS